MPDGLLLVAHGSRSAEGQREMEQLAATVASKAPAGVLVDMGYLELSKPPAGLALDRLVAAGADEIAVVPLMLLSAGHAKSDVPAVVLEARGRHPRVALHYARPLGIDAALLELARRRIRERGGAGAAVALLARGTSDPDANADAHKISRLIAEATGAELATTGFSGVTWPNVTGALDQLHRLGTTRVVAFSWFLATGILLERIRDELAAFSSRTGVQVVDAGHLGPAPEVADVVLARAREAVAGAVRINCDVCVYRAPFAGSSARVGRPRGEGHSHLAFEHRHHHLHHEDDGSTVEFVPGTVVTGPDDRRLRQRGLDAVPTVGRVTGPTGQEGVAEHVVGPGLLLSAGAAEGVHGRTDAHRGET